MKVKLLRRARIWANAGDTVDVSPDEAEFLISVGSAEKVVTTKKKTEEKK